MSDSFVKNNFPNIPLGPIVNKDGNLTSPWQQFFSQIIMFMNRTITSEGIVLPQQPNSVLTGSGVLNNINSIGALIYNQTNNTPMINLNGEFKTITTS